MFRETKALSSFSVNDLTAAKKFYGDTLGVVVEDGANMHILTLILAGGGKVLIYPKTDHMPATFTVLNFIVADIDDAVDKLRAKHVAFESYEGAIKTDEKGVSRGEDAGSGPNIAWFKDPAGNILSVIEEQ